MTDFMPALLELFQETNPTDTSAAAFVAWAADWLQQHPLNSLVLDHVEDSLLMRFQYHTAPLRLGRASGFSERHKSFNPGSSGMTNTAPRSTVATPEGNNCIGL